MQRILIHIKSQFFVKCAHLHQGYATKLVVRSRYYHCHWTVLTISQLWFSLWLGAKQVTSLSENVHTCILINQATA